MAAVSRVSGNGKSVYSLRVKDSAREPDARRFASAELSQQARCQGVEIGFGIHRVKCVSMTVNAPEELSVRLASQAARRSVSVGIGGSAGDQRIAEHEEIIRESFSVKPAPDA